MSARWRVEAAVADGVPATERQLSRWSVEVAAVAAENEDRREREKQQGEGKPSGSQGGLESFKGDHVSKTRMRGRGDSYRRIILYQRAHSYRALMGVWGIPYRRASEVEGEIPAYAGMTFGFAGMT